MCIRDRSISELTFGHNDLALVFITVNDSFFLLTGSSFSCALEAPLLGVARSAVSSSCYVGSPVPDVVVVVAPLNMVSSSASPTTVDGPEEAILALAALIGFGRTDLPPDA